MIPWLLHRDEPGRDLSSHLHPQELAEGRRYRHPGRHRQWQHGRQTAKLLLLKQGSDTVLAQCSAPDIWIHRTELGWPEVRDSAGRALPLSLSISHTDQHALCGLHHGSQDTVGVDLESIAPRPDSLLEDFYTDREHSYLQSLKGSERDRQATIFWTVKEALLKALRTGLTENAKRVEIVSRDFPQEDDWLRAQVCLGDGQTTQALWRTDEENNLAMAMASLDRRTTS